MKYILAIVLLLLAATVYFISRPQPVYEVGKETAATPPASEAAPVEAAETAAETESASEKAADEERVAAMKAEFEKLEKARHNLERRLSRLKAVLYGVEVAPEERNIITDKMKTGYGLLKNKKMLALYESPEAISEELAQVEYISNYLEEVEQTYREKRRQQ